MSDLGFELGPYVVENEYLTIKAIELTHCIIVLKEK